MILVGNLVVNEIGFWLLAHGESLAHWVVEGGRPGTLYRSVHNTFYGRSHSYSLGCDREVLTFSRSWMTERGIRRCPECLTVIEQPGEDE